MKTKYLMWLLLLTACAPARIQGGFATFDNGHTIHHVQGYTDLGEINPGDSKKYMDKAMSESDLCGDGGYELQGLKETKTHNGAGEFFYWEGQGECKKRNAHE